MKHIENIVVGTTDFSPYLWLASDMEDWLKNELPKTVFEEERFLPKILVKYGFFSSISEIRRNRADLMKVLIDSDFFEIKIGKKKLWFLVGK